MLWRLSAAPFGSCGAWWRLTSPYNKAVVAIEHYFLFEEEKWESLGCITSGTFHPSK
jgi:hypothetical protein